MKTRVVSALVGAPLLFLVILWSGGRLLPGWPAGWPFGLLVVAMTLVALGEFYRGCRRAGHQTLDLVGYAAAALFLMPALRLGTGLGNQFGLTVVLMASLVWE